MENIVIDMSSKGIIVPESSIVRIDKFLELNYIIEIKRIFDIVDKYSKIFVYNLADFMEKLEDKKIPVKPEIKENVLYGLSHKDRVDALWEGMDVANLFFNPGTVPSKVTAVFTSKSINTLISNLITDPTFIGKDSLDIKNIFNESIEVNDDIISKEDFCNAVNIDDFDYMRLAP